MKTNKEIINRVSWEKKPNKEIIKGFEKKFRKLVELYHDPNPKGEPKTCGHSSESRENAYEKLYDFTCKRFSKALKSQRKEIIKKIEASIKNYKEKEDDVVRIALKEIINLIKDE